MRRRRTGVHYHVYIVQLDSKVLERKKFAERNPRYRQGKPCVYVGMTGLTPEQRFRNHKRDYKANRYVRDFGLHLRPDLYPDGSPFNYDEAQRMERHVARELRALGYGVWQE